MKGFSPRNLKYMRAFAEAWPDSDFVQAVLAQLPWYHQLALLDKLESKEDRLWYAQQAIEYNWSRNVLVIQIETRSEESGSERPSPILTCICPNHSRIWRESAQRPLPPGFSGAGQKRLKSARLKPPWLNTSPNSCWSWARGSLMWGGRYIWKSAATIFSSTCCSIISSCVAMWSSRSKRANSSRSTWGARFLHDCRGSANQQEQDAATIGLLLCKSKNKVVAEYALHDATRPMGIAEYQLIESLPVALQTSLPSIEQIEQELAGDAGGGDNA